jgi:predicted kinase
MTEVRPRANLILVCGLPGSGKTSHAMLVEQKLPAVRLCADEWMADLGINLWNSEARQRIEQLQWKIAQQILSRGGSVVIEWGTWARSERDALRMGARKLGAAVELHFLDAPLEILFDRIHRRDTETPAIAFEDLEKWARVFERPSSEEMALFDEPQVPIPAAN